ncbi:MAG TPA: DUF4124 domain-containing protein [Noviherbaspirillum sp.]
MKRTIAVCMVILLLAAPARGDAIYKYRMPDGSILYTQAPQKQGRLLKVLQVQQQPSARQAALTAQRVKQERVRADELAAQRRETEAAQNDLHLAMQALAHAETALQRQYAAEPGIVIYPGYGGYPVNFEGGGPYWHHWRKVPDRSHYWGAPMAGNPALTPLAPAVGFPGFPARRRVGP